MAVNGLALVHPVPRWRRGARACIGFIAGLALTFALVAFPGSAAAQYTVKSFTGGPVTVADGAAATYPSTVSVIGTPSIVGDVTVRLDNVTHQFPDELDVLLVGPGGQSTLLMSDAGGSGGAVNRDLTFSDDASASLPDPLVSGTYKPADVDDLSSDAFPAPAPAGPFGSELGVFDRTYSEGTWKLFVVDDTPLDGGSISGWRLTLSGRARALVSSVGSLLATEGDPIRITVTRALPPFFGDIPGGEIPLQPAQLSYAVEAGFATDYSGPLAAVGTDFVPVSGTFDFAAADTTKLIETQTVEDHVPEPAEILRLAFPAGVGDIGVPFGGTLGFQINDDDPKAAPPSIAKSAAQRILRQRAVILKATSNAYGSLSGRGTIKLPSAAAAKVRLKAVRKQVSAGQQTKLRLRLSRAALRQVRLAFASTRRLTARVTVTAKDLADNKASKLVRVRLRR
jgi:subtilisin-like proprotein convertase family protein